MNNIITTFLVCLTTLFVQAQNVTAFHEDGIYLYGLKDNAGTVVVKPKYDYHEYLEYGLIKMRLDNNWTLFDSTGKEINFYHIIYDFEYVKDLKGKYARVEKNHKYGYIDTSGREIISPIYNMGGFSEGYAVIRVSDNHFGFIDVHSKLAIDTTLQYHRVGNFSNGLAEVWLSGYLYDGTGNIITDEAKISGYIDKTGKEVIPLKYQSKQEFFKNGTEILVINTKSKDIRTYVGAKPTQQPVELFKSENGKYGFKKKKYTEEYGMYKMTDTIVIQAKYDTVCQTVYDHLGTEVINKTGYFVFISNKIGLVDSLGNEVTPVKYDWIDYHYFGGEYTKVKLNGKTGLIDKLGKEVIAPAYYDVGKFSEGLAWVQSKQGGNFGYIDANGKLVIDTTLNYVVVHSFSEGLAIVENRFVNPENGEEHTLFGYIDKTGKEIIPLKYILAEDFRNGKAKVAIDQYTELYIDKNGNVVK